jgi:sugar phosphate isomerase/epimerase
MRLSYTVATPEVARMPLAWVGDAATVLPSLAEIGYGGVELQTRDPGAFDTAAFHRQVRAAGLVVTGVSSGPAATDDGLYLTSPDAAVRAETLRRLTSILELAAEYGTHMAIGSACGFARWAGDRETALRWLRPAISTLVERAAALGTRIVLEPQSRSFTDLFNTVAQALAFVESFDTDLLGIEADSYHMALEERSVPAALVTASRSGRLVHVQISDTNRLAPGWGHLSWADFFGTLRALGYQGWVCVEAAQQPHSAAVARQGYRLAELVGAEEVG